MTATLTGPPIHCTGFEVSASWHHQKHGQTDLIMYLNDVTTTGDREYNLPLAPTDTSGSHDFTIGLFDVLSDVYYARAIIVNGSDRTLASASTPTTSSAPCD
jgi:hypothetical protein